MLSVATIWWTFGFPMLIYLAGLQNIPETYYEAARIDEAIDRAVLRYITLRCCATSSCSSPSRSSSRTSDLRPTYIMTEGGRAALSHVIMYLYQTGWRFYRMGYGSAIAIGLALVILFFTLLQLRFFGAGAGRSQLKDGPP